MTDSLPDRIRRSRILLQNPYAYLNDRGTYDAKLPRDDESKCVLFTLRPDELRNGKPKGARFSNTEIERIARTLQREMWVNREEIWTDEIPSDPIELLKPSVALSVVGYDFELRDSLGQIPIAGQMIEAAGIIDDTEECVQVSHHFPLETQNFTAAHELGHALMHHARGLHRDRALDGASRSGSRDIVEIEADKFATFFLMPEKVVRARFRARFNTECFMLDDDTAFALTSGSLANLEKRCSGLRDLSRMLASAEQYAGRHFYSIATQFQVSIEAMAIRIEELKLVKL